MLLVVISGLVLIEILILSVVVYSPTLSVVVYSPTKRSDHYILFLNIQRYFGEVSL